MPRPHQRTRSKKRTSKATPGAVGRIHYKDEVNALPHCRLCGQLLAGISRLSLSRASKFNRSKRRIWRLHGGQICHNCLKSALRQTARTL